MWHMPISASTLRAEVDNLDRVRRTALLATRARDLAGTAELAGLLDELRVDEPGWALFMAVVAGHRPVIGTALAGDDILLAISAVPAWIAARPGADEVWAVLADAPAELRSRLYLALRAGHTDLAGALIDRVRARFGDREAATVLVACAPELVGRLLPELGHAVPNWHALGSRHPDAVLAEARRCLAPLPVPAREQWWRSFATGVLVHRAYPARGRARPAR